MSVTMRSKARGRRLAAAAALLLAFAGVATAQGTLEDYRRAERFLGWNARRLVTLDSVVPNWLPDDRFWYRNRIDTGHEFVLVDPGARRRRPAFDHARLAAALSAAADTTYEPFRLPFNTFEFLEDGRSIRFRIGEAKRWSCDLAAYRCTGPDSVPEPPVTEVRSPDGRWAAFERDGDLFLRSLETDEEVRLSDDGEPDYGYAINRPACCDQVTSRRQERRKRPVVLWSPDSKRLATHRWDERGVRLMHLLETTHPAPVLHSYRYALPGDTVIPKYELFVFDIETRRKVRIETPAQEAVNTTCCWLMADTIWKDVRWGGDGSELFFTVGRRGYQQLDLMAADAAAGAARTLVTERSATFIETNLASGGVPNWRVVNGNRDLIWFSERDGWAHLYRYDARTGELRNRITEGPWTVGDLLRIDEANGWIYFTGRGREPGRDPHLRHLYRIRFDGSGLTLLTPEDADHEIAFSPGGRYFVDSYSRMDAPPVAVLRRADGRVVLTLEEADASRLVAGGWPMPEPFVVKARDGVTDIHGVLYRPSTYDPSRTYPLIDNIYPGPQVGSIGARSFSANRRGHPQALAELGFIVMQIDALGAPLRSKALHDAWYGNMGDNGLPDHVAAIRQLAERDPSIDADRVGIYGHSGGGFSSTGAILRYPDIFKVAVSSAGNHDNRGYDYTWGEKYQGLLRKNEDGTDSFDSQANWRLAKNLRGRLLLMYGTLDDNVHPNATLELVDALIQENRNFDLVVLPNRNHGYADEPYVLRRTWDYFVRHLLGIEPPEEFRIEPPDEMKVPTVRALAPQ